MSLNWRELSLILSELPLQGSLIQKVTQNTFHAITWDLYRPDLGKWRLYSEIGTPHARLHALSSLYAPQQRQKTPKLQRFVQFCRANIEGARITGYQQIPQERMVRFDLEHQGKTLYLYFRLFSGPQANIIITDEQNTILDLLLRRPNRDETSGNVLELPKQKQLSEDDMKFPVRERTSSTFNEQIEQEYGDQASDLTLDQLTAKVQVLRDRELRRLENTVKSLERKRDENAGFESYRLSGDLLSSCMHLIHPHTQWVSVPDWSKEGQETTIALDPKLTPSENIAAYFAKYQKAKGTWANACEEYEQAQATLDNARRTFDAALNNCGDMAKDIARLQRLLKQHATEISQDKPKTPGLVCTSGQYTLLVGRNAKENDELLRRHTRGNDYWMHVRDYPGGYVFIKYIKDKSVPLDVLLDAANLALVFSKAKDAKKADLYYTQVKYLRRAKGGKTGLVIPTQEKNLSVQLDESRLGRLLYGEQHANQTS